MGSLSDQTIVPLTKYLDNFSNFLKKAETYANANGIPHEQILTHRLIDDQKGLIFQVQSMSDVIKNWLVDFGAMKAVTIPDEEKTFADLHARIELMKTQLAEADKTAIDALGNKEVIVRSSMHGEFVFKSGQTYVSEVLFAYFHFRLTTAYCLLRAQGVDLGLVDFLNGVLVKKTE